MIGHRTMTGSPIGRPILCRRDRPGDDRLFNYPPIIAVGRRNTRRLCHCLDCNDRVAGLQFDNLLTLHAAPHLRDLGQFHQLQPAFFE